MYFCLCRELARVLGEKGVIVFSDVEHVIMKSMFFFIFYGCKCVWLLRKYVKEE